ncbi:MAG: DEAD/DEAH box helicase [Alicyclobacillus sp.]|nr:DEAD/DEAH box helicase [Alicyclobacillus sp.]
MQLHGVWLPQRMFVYATEADLSVADPVTWLPIVRLLGLSLHPNEQVQRWLYLPQWPPSRETTRDRSRAPRPRRIPGLDVTASDAFRFTLQLSDLGDPYRLTARGLSIGPDLFYWQAVSRFALDLLYRGRFTPGLRLQANTTRHFVETAAVWQADTSLPRDTAWQSYLADSMPAACSNFSAQDGGRLYGLPPAELLAAVLDTCIDTFVREVLHGPGTADAGVSADVRVMHPGRRRQFEQWFEGLFDPRPVPTYSTRTDAQQLEELIVRWVTPTPAKSPVRLGFRLEEPAEGDSEVGTDSPPHTNLDTDAVVWRLTPFVQAAADPSLTVSADDLWRGAGAARVFPNLTPPQVQSLAAGQWRTALDVFPTLAGWTADPSAPTAVGLSTSQAYHFLSVGAPALQQAGFVVQVPSFWTRAGRRRLRVQLQPHHRAAGSPQSPTRFGLAEWMSFQAAVSLGDERLSEQELTRLAEAKSPLVHLRGQWTEVSPQAVEEALHFLRAHNGRVSIFQLLEQMAESSSQTTVARDDGEVDVVFEYNLPDEVLSFVEGRWTPPQLATPVSLRAELRPYQQRGFEWLAALTDLGVGACLADDMGLGKTVQLIALLCDLHEQTEPARRSPALIVCPTSVLGNWQHELQRFAPRLRTLVHHGSRRATEAAFAEQACAHDVVLTTYPLLLRDEAALGSVDWSVIAIDEAQQIKNSASKQARALYRIADRNAGRTRRIALSGTPVENRLAELWSVFRFLNPGYLGNRERFQERFAHPIERHHDAEKAALLRAMVAPMVLRRVKTDAAIAPELPEKIEAKEYCPLTREQASLYQATVDDVMRRVEQTEAMARRGLILASLTRLKQICDHPALFLRDGSALEGRSGKLQRLTELLREIRDGGEAALVFTQYREMGELLVQHLTRALKEEPLFLHGGVPKQQRDELVAAFQAPGGPGVFVLSIRAGGVGLNLTRASHVIHFDRWWNPAVERQATDRAFRIGQTQTVEVHTFICQGTLEERIDEMMEEKRFLSEQVIRSGEGWIAELGADELRHLFSLRKGYRTGGDEA